MAVTIIFLPAKFGKTAKKQIAYQLNQMGTNESEPISIEQVLDLFIDQFKLKHDWQSQVYTIIHTEIDILFNLGHIKMLCPFTEEFYTRECIVFENDELFIFLLDSFIFMLKDRIKDNILLKNLYLFILENTGLPGIMVVPKQFYKITGLKLPFTNS